MSKKDDITKAYMSAPTTFADMFNAYLYEGRRVIDSTHLEELDPTEIADLM